MHLSYHSVLRPVFSILVIIVMIAQSSLLFAAEISLDEFLLQKDKLPAGWELNDSISVPKEKLRIFESRFAARVDEVVNQVVTVNSNEKIQVNYIASPTVQTTDLIYRSLIELTGGANAIGRHENIVIEILTGQESLKNQVVTLLGISELYKRKLAAKDVPENWNLVKEFFVYGNDRDIIEKRFSADIGEIVNQFFLVGSHTVRINYIACTTDQAAMLTYQKLNKFVEQSNTVLQVGRLVVEIVVKDQALRDEAVKLIRGI